MKTLYAFLKEAKTEYGEHFDNLHKHLGKFHTMSASQRNKFLDHVDNLRRAAGEAHRTANQSARGIAKHETTEHGGELERETHHITNNSGHKLVVKTKRYGGGPVGRHGGGEPSVHIGSGRGKKIDPGHHQLQTIKKWHGQGKYDHHFGK